MNIKIPVWSELNQERPVSAVPKAIILSLILSVILQISWHHLQPKPVAKTSELVSPPVLEVLKLASVGEPVAFSKLLMFRLQAFDNQPGVSLSFRKLDYEKVIAWLRRIAQLDLNSQYPYLAAARIYALVPDDKKKRMMLNFVRDGFLRNPDLQWPAMAHAVFIAKHRLNDLELALQYAKDIRLHLRDSTVHSWVRQMELFVLEDMGDLESARILLGGFLDSGIIKDEKEYRFLRERLGVPENQ
ncbi:MAG: hypothetical protein ACI9SC_000894 [Gammaproteobacteria bacterium]|jgi:hypothetical protein